MPAAFAHDLYGRLVYEKLPDDLKKIIRKEKDCFYLGLHGPDLLFFYRPLGENVVNRKGVRMHRNAALGIFENGRGELNNSLNSNEQDMLLAYLLGFSCHFSMDNRLHGFVNETMRLTGLSHGDIETELDRRLLVREGYEPLRTSCTCHLKNTPRTRFAAGRILGEPAVVISEAIVGFKTVNRIFINSGELTKQVISLSLKCTKHHGDVNGMMMRKKPVSGSALVTDNLEKLFFGAVEPGVKLLLDVNEYLTENGPVPEKLYGNFDGDMEIRPKNKRKETYKTYAG